MPLAAIQYTDFNIGVENVTQIKKVVQYTDFNVGLEPVDVRDDVEYTDFNVGLEPQPQIGAEYVDFNFYLSTGQYHRGVYLDFNIDPDEPPTPHIWYVRPQWGREGLVYNVIGMGFGTTQEEFGGVVKLGPLVSPVMQWELQDAQTSHALRIGGYAISDVDFDGIGGYLPYVAVRRTLAGNTANSIVLATGDIIEFDYIRRTTLAPLDGEIHPIPHFTKLNSGATTILNWLTAPTMDVLVDTEGRPWAAQIDSEVGEVVHRKFIVPSSLNGVRAGNWGAALWGQSTIGRPPRTADFARYVVRSADLTPKFWVTLDDDSVANFAWGAGTGFPQPGADAMGAFPEINWTVSSFVNAPFLPNFIDYGATNVEHEWLIVVVPEGAESGMVKVVLEDL